MKYKRRLSEKWLAGRQRLIQDNFSRIWWDVLRSDNSLNKQLYTVYVDSAASWLLTTTSTFSRGCFPPWFPASVTEQSGARHKARHLNLTEGAFENTTRRVFCLSLLWKLVELWLNFIIYITLSFSFGRFLLDFFSDPRCTSQVDFFFLGGGAAQKCLQHWHSCGKWTARSKQRWVIFLD